MTTTPAAVEPAFQDVVTERLDLKPVLPGPLARVTTLLIGPSPTPRLRATARGLSPRAHFWRRISRICRMDSRSAAIAPLSAAGADGPAGPSKVACSGARPPFGSRVACSRSPVYVFTAPILAFTMSDPGVHVAPICVFTMPCTQ